MKERSNQLQEILEEDQIFLQCQGIPVKHRSGDIENHFSNKHEKSEWLWPRSYVWMDDFFGPIKLYVVPFIIVRQ